MESTRSMPVATPPAYQPPTLDCIGDAIDVVLGPPGGGWDGPYGISELEFEFEPDGDSD
jgi:hypothetical protein